MGTSGALAAEQMVLSFFANVSADSDEVRRSTGRLFHVAGPGDAVHFPTGQCTGSPCSWNHWALAVWDTRFHSARQNIWQTVEKLRGPNFQTPRSYFGGHAPLGTPIFVRVPMLVIYQLIFTVLVSFYGSPRVLSWLVINSNQLEVYLTNFQSTESKSGIP